MAERRMFAKTIIDSDAFIDMPLTAQAFYFHLSMRADDDGFVNNPKKIQRMIGCADDDMRLLIAKRFVIPFESGVCVIKHWKIHNYIQNDRYKETVYQDEKRLLITKENRAYSLSEEACIQIGYNMDTQNRLDKDSKELDKDSTSQQCEDASRSLSVDYQSVIDMFNTVCVSLPTVKILTGQRRKAIKALYPFSENHHTNGILLSGGVGSGKTFFSAAVANAVIDMSRISDDDAERAGKGIMYRKYTPVRFTSTVELLEQLKATYNAGSGTETAQNITDRLKKAPLLVLDDMGAEKPSEWVSERLFEIVDYRYNEELPVIITTNATPQELKQKIGERSFDRLREMCIFIPVTAKSQRQTAKKEV